MGRYLGRRLGEAVLTLFGITVICFTLLHLVPFSPAVLILGRGATPAKVAAINKALGLNLPIPLQYVHWLQTIFTQHVLSFPLLQLMPPTLVLLVASALLAMILTIIIATLQVLYPKSTLDHALTVVTYFFYTIPAFWMALVLIYVMAIVLLWFPATGVQDPLTPGFGPWVAAHVLPVITIALTAVGGWARHLRATMENSLKSDYTRTARAKGLREWVVVVRHALRNSLLPMITLAGMSFPTMLNSLIVVESAFAMPGLGSGLIGTLNGFLFDAVNIVFVIGLLTVLGNLAADLLYGLADPRIQYT